MPPWLRKDIDENKPYREERGQEKEELLMILLGEPSAAPGAGKVLIALLS